MIRFAASIFLALFSLGTSAAVAPTQQAFLIQNSGWMEPFYTAPSSQFKALAGAVIGHVGGASDKIFVSAFNQTAGDNKSPVLLHGGSAAIAPATYLNALGIAKKNAGGTLADTDFQEAVVHVIKNQFQAKPGIIWIFTNNKNSPNNDLQTTQRNKDFYRLIHLEPSISRTLAFPLRMPVKGKLYSANGLMVYALAYGEEASQYLAHMLDTGHLAKIFTIPPARLKPLDQDSVRLIPKKVTNSENVTLGLAADGKTLLVDVTASNLLPQIKVKASIENLFYPYEISTAMPTAFLTGDWGTSAVALTPNIINDVEPGEEREVTVLIPIPMAQIPSPWSATALSAMGKQVLIPAVLEIALDKQQLSVSSDFRKSLAAIFPGDPFPDLFVPPDSVKSSSARLPLIVRIQYPLLPLVMVLLGGLALLGSSLGILYALSKPSRLDVIADGSKRSILLKAFSTGEIKDENGTVIGSVKRTVGKPRIVKVAEGHSLTNK